MNSRNVAATAWARWAWVSTSVLALGCGADAGAGDTAAGETAAEQSASNAAAASTQSASASGGMTPAATAEAAPAAMSGAASDATATADADTSAGSVGQAPAATTPGTAGAAAADGQPNASVSAGASSESAGNGAMAMGMDDATGADAASAGDSAAPLPSPGCMNGSITSGHTDETIQVGSARRQYVQTVPSTYDGKTPFKVLLDFHGGTYDGKRWDERATNKFHEMAETEQFIYITPTGLNQWWTTTEGEDGADGMFMHALLDRIKTEACVDTRRIYATGCSMGGDMSFYMACYFSDQIAASLPLCGSASFDLDKECMPKRPISVEFVIGSRDTLNCWAPPRTSVGNPCATEVQATFKRLNNCMGEPKKTHNGKCETLDQCAEDTEVTICSVDAEHVTIYENPDLDVYTEGWEWLKRFYIH